MPVRLRATLCLALAVSACAPPVAAGANRQLLPVVARSATFGSGPDGTLRTDFGGEDHAHALAVTRRRHTSGWARWWPARLRRGVPHGSHSSARSFASRPASRRCGGGRGRAETRHRGVPFRIAPPYPAVHTADGEPAARPIIG